jgi:hypothetical protein
MKISIVITSINSIDSRLLSYFDIYNESNIIWVGDTKTKKLNESDKRVIDYDINKQTLEEPNLSSKLPYSHYSRKNLGYVLALKSGVEFVLDTDDDNFPYDEYKKFPLFEGGYEIISSQEWVNIYKYFTKSYIWPRGLPHSEIATEGKKNNKRNVKIGLWQGLADISPDVDAIYRLAGLPDVNFDDTGPYGVQKGTWTPFNSQNTLWPINNIALAYIPSTVSFRYCDILRSIVAQKALWNSGEIVGFSKASVYQLRNEHNLLHDLSDEISMYESINLAKTIVNDIDESNHRKFLIKVYKRFYEAGISKKEEIEILTAYLDALNAE